MTVDLVSSCYASPEVFLGKAMDQKLFFIQKTNLSKELIKLILSMLNVEPEKCPTVTELRFNDYVRKQIWHSVQAPSHRSYLSQDCSSKMRRSTPSRINSDINSSIYFHELGARSKHNKEVFKTFPDINGNGDGNDNSQQQTINDEIVWRNRNKTPSNKLNETLGCKKQLPETLSDNNFQKTVNNNFYEEENIASNSKKTEERLNFDFQIIKSENSFKLLNTLTNFIIISRFKSLESVSNESLSFKT